MIIRKSTYYTQLNFECRETLASPGKIQRNNSWYLAIA